MDWSKPPGWVMGTEKPMDPQQFAPQPLGKTDWSKPPDEIIQTAQPGPVTKNTSWMQRIREEITGEGKGQYDYDELPRLIYHQGEAVPIQEYLSFDAGNVGKQAETLKNRLGIDPGDIDVDDDGYQTVKIGGKDFYVNRPGASMADAYRVAEDLMLFGVSGSVAGGAMKKGAGLGARMVAQGAAAGTASAIEDIVNSPGEIDGKKAALLASMGVGGEIAGTVVAKLIGRFSSSKKLYNDGELTERGIEVLKDNGIDPEVITPDFVNLFAAKGKPVMQEGLPHPVPMSRGQFMGDTAQMGKEEAIRHGVQGEDAQRIIRGLDDQQQSALSGNALALKEQMGAGMQYRGEGAGQVFKDVAQKRKDIRAPVKELYESAKKQRAFVPGEHVKEFASKLENALVEETVPIEGAVKSRLDTLNKLVGDDGKVAMHKLEAWRKMSTRAMGQADPQSKYGLGMIVRNYDSMIMSDVTKDLIEGSKEAPAMWRKAISSWKRQANIVGEAFEKKILKNPEVTDQEALNFILGASKVGTNQKAAKMVGEVKRIFGEESDQVGMLRDEFFSKLLNGQPEKGFSARKYVSNLRRMEMDNKQVFDALFNKEHREALYSLSKISQRTITPDEVSNPSKSAFSFFRMLGGKFGPNSSIGLELMQKWVFDPSKVSAKRALTLPAKPKRNFIPPSFVAPSLAGILYDQS